MLRDCRRLMYILAEFMMMAVSRVLIVAEFMPYEYIRICATGKPSKSGVQ
jgi:hypothetical protein